MILEKLIIKNFRSYYSDNTFVLSKGLTLIIGDNGDGKTTFFEALEWLFDTSTDNKNVSNVSEKRKSELEIGETDEVSVSLFFEHNGHKELEKSFMFEKNANGVNTKNFKFIGYNNEGVERISINGKNLLESCFDTVIRKYCLFKGERDLNVFNNDTALKTLVDTFSGIKKFDELYDLTSEFERKSQDVVTRELKNDKKQKNEIDRIESDLSQVSQEIRVIKIDIDNKERKVNEFANKIRLLEENQDACENYQKIKERIKKKQEEKSKLIAFASLDYNSALLDDYWVLRPFPSIIDEFQKKISLLSREKRKLEKDENERIAIEKGKKEAIENIQKLANGAVPLPWNLPDKQTMQEMIDEEVCKVCGRPAPKGSEPYIFMTQKLNEYLEHVKNETNKKQQEERIKPLFLNHYINELNTRSIQLSGDTERTISCIASNIAERLEYIQSRKNDLEKINKDLQEAEDAKVQLLIQNNELTEEILDKNFRDFKGLTDSNKKTELDLAELKRTLGELERRKADLKAEQNNLTPTNVNVKIFQKVHTSFEKIMDAFLAAKNNNISEFIYTLEQEANKYLVKLNANDFHGTVRLIRTTNDSARITLFSSNGSQVHNPSGSQLTTMYMSVLFAISNITTLKREQDYPLIFDAPSSSLGYDKQEEYYNLIDKLDKQCIIVTKDFLVDSDKKIKDLNMDKINKLTSSVYRITKIEGFNQSDLSTIQTQIIPIKN